MTHEESDQNVRLRNDPYYEDEINLIDLLRVLWKWKYFIVILIVLCSGVAIGITTVIYPARYVTNCIISLNFPGIEEHKNPDNTMFAKGQIITPNILMRATSFLQKDDKSFSEIDLREMIGIEPIISPRNVKKKEKEPDKFYPNKFNLTLTSGKDGIFSTKKKNQILTTIVNEYRADFERKYEQEPLVVVEFPANFLANSDYIDVVKTFKEKIDIFIKFLNFKIKKAGFFRSQKTGESFIDLKSDLELLKNIEVAQIEATIETLKLTKNKENIINLYRHQIRVIEVERKKRQNEALVAKELLKDMRQSEEYRLQKGAVSNKGDTSLVLDTTFIQNLVKEDSSSFLLKTALEAEVAAKKKGVDKDYLQKEIAILEGTEKGTEKEKITFVQTKMKDIKDRIIVLSTKANNMNSEYLGALFSNAVKVIEAPKTYKTRAVSIKKIVLLSSVAALFMAIFSAFFIEYIKNANRTTLNYPNHNI